MFYKLIACWTDFVHRYPILATADVAAVFALIAYMVLG